MTVTLPTHTSGSSHPPVALFRPPARCAHLPASSLMAAAWLTATHLSSTPPARPLRCTS